MRQNQPLIRAWPLALAVLVMALASACACKRQGGKSMSNDQVTTNSVVVVPLSKPRDDQPCPLDAKQREALDAVEAREQHTFEVNALLDRDFGNGLERLYALEACGHEQLTWALQAMLWKRRTREIQPSYRQATVDVLVGGLSGKGDFLQGQAIKFLSDYRAADYTTEAREKLAAVPLDVAYSAELVRLLGIVGIHAHDDELKELASDEPEIQSNVQGEQWAALLALARMGDHKALERVLARVEGEEDVIVRSTTLFPDLAYTRRQESFDLLRTYLSSEERLPSVKETDPGTPVAQLAAVQFALHVEGCPVHGEDVSEQDLATIRTWAQAQETWRFAP